MTATELRSKRIEAEISASLLAANAKVNRSRLSNIERGYIEASAGELSRLAATLDRLIDAKAAVDHIAAAVGWPIGGHRER